MRNLGATLLDAFGVVAANPLGTICLIIVALAVAHFLL